MVGTGSSVSLGSLYINVSAVMQVYTHPLSPSQQVQQKSAELKFLQNVMYCFLNLVTFCTTNEQPRSILSNAMLAPDYTSMS